AHADALRRRGLALLDLLRTRPGAAQERRGDDAAGPARADGPGVLPDRARVLAPLRPARRPDGPAAGALRGHAPRPDEPRPGDLRRSGRLGPLHHHRAGRQRRLGPHGGALPAARRQRTGDRHRGRGRAAMSRNWTVKGAAVLGGTPRDLHLRDGLIVEEAAPDATVIDASGLIALPGLVDLHTHLREPGREDAETV